MLFERFGMTKEARIAYKTASNLESTQESANFKIENISKLKKSLVSFVIPNVKELKISSKIDDIFSIKNKEIELNLDDKTIDPNKIKTVYLALHLKKAYLLRSYNNLKNFSVFNNFGLIRVENFSNEIQDISCPRKHKKLA